MVKEFPTVKDALAAGYTESTPYVPCIGAHYTNIALRVVVRSRAPVGVAVRRHQPTDSKIVGLSYLVWHTERTAARLRGSERPLAPAQRERRTVLKGGFVVGG